MYHSRRARPQDRQAGRQSGQSAGREDRIKSRGAGAGGRVGRES